MMKAVNKQQQQHWQIDDQQEGVEEADQQL